MSDLDNQLIVRRLRAVLEAEDGHGAASEEQWAAVTGILEAHAWTDEGLAAAVQGRDTAEIRRRVVEWDAGKQPLPAPDRAVLKRALKAFRKRLKLQQLDEESTIGGGPFSAGRHSRIVAIRPPDQYPGEVWVELVHQGRLRDAGQGFFELVE